MHGDKITTCSTVFYMKKVNKKRSKKRYTYYKYMGHKNAQGKVAKEIFKPLIKSSTGTYNLLEGLTEISWLKKRPFSQVIV